jgi:hypothetical protein
MVLRHFCESETELFSEKGARDLDKTQISDIRDDASAILSKNITCTCVRMRGGTAMVVL